MNTNNTKMTKEKLIKVNNKTIEFIKNYLIKELQINKPIDRDLLCDIVDYCDQYDQQFATREINPNFIIKDEEKCYRAGELVSDITGIWSKNDVDINDLNERLGLK